MAPKPIRRRFSTVDELQQIADELPTARKTGDVLVAHGEDGNEEWDKIYERSGIVVEGYGAVGAISESDDYYNVIDFGEPLAALADKVRRSDDVDDVSGRVQVNKWGKKMSALATFDGENVTATPFGQDRIDMGLRLSTAHTGFQKVKVEVGGHRVVCSNGMVAFDDDLTFEQSHQDPFNPALVDQAVDATVDSVGDVEARMERAREYEFNSVDEALLVLMDAGLDGFLDDDALETFREALDRELDYYDEFTLAAPENPTLYDVYNAATHAISNMADLPGHVEDAALERASNLIDRWGDVPTAESLASETVERRTVALAEEEATERFEGEREVVHQVAQARA